MLYDSSNIIFLSSLILLAFVGVFIAYCIGAWIQKHSTGTSPYTGVPLRRGGDLPYESAKAILKFLYDRQEYDNRIFDIKRAAICPETGRVFPNAISRLDTIHVDWGFLRKRYPGNYVSWGSLTELQQIEIRDAHESLEGFQIEASSSKASPKSIERNFAYTKPGPLYVDYSTKVLLGWVCVPDTDFEVMIVQLPKKPF